MTDQLDLIAGWLGMARRAIVFTGAGISTESGIPDFRGPNGVWRTTNPELATLQAYLADPEVRRTWWRNRLRSPVDAAEPNAGHHAVAELERLGVVQLVVTQNIDRLHQRAGSRDVVELHGNTREAGCLRCGARMPVERVLSRVAEGDDDPACERCGGILKVATISFGQALVEADVERAVTVAAAADVCLAVGSTLAVWPAAGVPLQTARSGGRLAIVNDSETELDAAASALVRGRAGAVLAALVERVARLRAEAG